MRSRLRSPQGTAATTATVSLPSSNCPSATGSARGLCRGGARGRTEARRVNRCCFPPVFQPRSCHYQQKCRATRLTKVSGCLGRSWRDGADAVVVHRPGENTRTAGQVAWHDGPQNIPSSIKSKQKENVFPTGDERRHTVVAR